MSSPAKEHWVIFCRVVDFFGDAGFCWRLACALNDQGVGRVTLVIDRLDVLHALVGETPVPAVSVVSWQEAEQRWQSHGVGKTERADVVIEAFACDPPDIFLRSLSDQTQWITLDYLATELWADQVHGGLSPSPRLSYPAARRRRWFIPGFSGQTGGLLHGRWRHISADERRAWRAQLAGRPIADDVFLILGFGYEDAHWDRLMGLASEQLPKGFREPVIWKPHGIAFSQSEFDEVLQACDLNFVRGEDSFVRAHWASAGPWRVPFVWQPYRQQEGAHATKLVAWLSRVCADPRTTPLVDLHWAWNALPVNGQYLDLRLAWEDLVVDYQGVSAALHRACLALAAKPGLEAQLIGLRGQEKGLRKG